MAKYRKRPVVVDAEQFFVDHRPWPDGVIQTAPDPDFKTQFYIRTLEGSLQVREGDWIITGVKAEKYPCKPAIFDQTYDPV